MMAEVRDSRWTDSAITIALISATVLVALYFLKQPNALLTPGFVAALGFTLGATIVALFVLQRRPPTPRNELGSALLLVVVVLLGALIAVSQLRTVRPDWPRPLELPTQSADIAHRVPTQSVSEAPKS
jgi:predicted PurR-regulated permease PerM